MIEEEEQIDIEENEAPRKKLFTMEKSSRTSILFAILCLIISAASVGYSILLLVDYDYAIQLLRFYTDSGAGKAVLGWLMDLNAQIKLNFVDKDRFTTYILSGLGITFTVTFFATLIGIFRPA